MTTKDVFSNDEWDLVALTPIMVGLAVAKAGRSGLIGSIRETKTIRNAVGEADHVYPEDELIRAILAEHRYPTNELILAAIAIALEYNLEWAAGETHRSAKAVAVAAIEDCADVSAILRVKATPREFDEYQQWLLDIARQVAGAATENENPISEPESELIDKLGAALGSAVD